jgi:hypothetical protein
MKKTIGLISVVAIAMALTIAFSGVALCNGDVVESQSLNWEIDSGNLLDNLPLDDDEKYGKIGYNEKMIGLNGTTEFDKTFVLDTGTVPNLALIHLQFLQAARK